jgi:hypothetical protein
MRPGPTLLLRTFSPARPMPQLKLAFDQSSPSKSLTLSTNKTAGASTSTSTHRRSASSSAAAAYYKPGPNNLWQAHHAEEGIAAMAAKRSGRAEGDAAGQPGHKRERSPEGNGVAGRDAKKHKNAYEISGFASSFGTHLVWEWRLIARRGQDSHSRRCCKSGCGSSSWTVVTPSRTSEDEEVGERGVRSLLDANGGHAK